MNSTFDVLVLKRKRRIRVCVYLPFRPRWNIATVSGWLVVQTRGAGSRRGRRTPELTGSLSWSAAFQELYKAPLKVAAQWLIYGCEKQLRRRAAARRGLQRGNSIGARCKCQGGKGAPGSRPAAGRRQMFLRRPDPGKMLPVRRGRVSPRDRVTRDRGRRS
ncbi:hypothetical protein NDU88_001264 [Pleurodeles waltl]|uniref:Uncharacterized protein n=1 Tax=Pleurodeles waltl TaxID=8319 RepID=A0AAV7WLT6_PLEWA|nr:hypothetical protein NDU88_001264 [Pleurodeles waltl]